MKCLLTFNSSLRDDEVPRIELDNGKVSFVDKGVIDEKRYSYEYIKKVNSLNETMAYGKEPNLLFSTYNKLNVNCLSYICFYVTEIQAFVDKYKLSEIVLVERVPNDWYYPVSHFSGDSSRSIRYDFSFIYPLLIEFIGGVKFKYKKGRKFPFRPYIIFALKITLSIVYKIFYTLCSIVNVKHTSLNDAYVIRNRAGQKRYESYLCTKVPTEKLILIPSFNVIENIKTILHGCDVAIKLGSVTEKEFGQKKRIYISTNNSIASEKLLKYYKLEEVDKTFVYNFFTEREYTSLHSFDCLNEFGFFIQWASANTTFVQSYAMTLERSSYLPPFTSYKVSDASIFSSIKEKLPDSSVTMLTNTVSPYVKKNSIERLIVITQPNKSFEENFFKLSDLEDFCFKRGIVYKIKAHPRDTGRYRQSDVIDMKELFECGLKDKTLVLGFNSYLLFECFESGIGFLHHDKSNQAKLGFISSTNYCDSLEELARLVSFPSDFNKVQEKYYLENT